MSRRASLSASRLSVLILSPDFLGINVPNAAARISVGCVRLLNIM
jgi:hypothetical protein